MKNITIKNIPLGLHQSLQESAKLHRRSLNSEIISRLENSIGANEIDKEHFLNDVRKLRANVKGFLTQEDLIEMRDEGRP
jgi:plasmid stability protein